MEVEMHPSKALIPFFAAILLIGAAQAADVLKVRGTSFRVTVSSDGMLVKTWDRFTTTGDAQQVRSFDFATNRMCTVISTFADCVRKEDLTTEGSQAWEAAEKIRAERDFAR
jgi:hypothetical protein